MSAVKFKSFSNTSYTFLLVLLVWAAGSVSAQRVDYEQREKTARPEIKQRINDIRGRILQRNLAYTVGYTTAADETIQNLTGLVIPPDHTARIQRQNARAKQLLQADENLRLDYEKRVGRPAHDVIMIPSVDLPVFDWRTHGIITTVQNQKSCGSCWDFGALAAYESSFKKRNGISLNLSEQHILDCSKSGSCVGGWYGTVFDYLMSNGTVGEDHYSPYIAQSNPVCAIPNGVKTFQVVAWGYVTNETLPGTSVVRMPTVSEIKKALIEHGPLAAGIWVTEDLLHYTGGVFEESRPPGSKVDGLTVQPDGSLMGPYYGQIVYAENHVILIIGWSDAKQAWLIKNSWGQGWGETGGFGTDRGYGWIKYYADSVGIDSGWVKSVSNTWSILKPNINVVPRTIDPVIKPKPTEIKPRQVIIKPTN